MTAARSVARTSLWLRGLVLFLMLGPLFAPSAGRCGKPQLLPAIAPAADRKREVRHVSPASCMPRAEDYTYMWWADGFRGRSPEGRWLRCIQTGRYALVMDVASLQVTALGRVTRPASYAQALTQDPAWMAQLPPADLVLSITVDGREYRAVKGGDYDSHAGPRLTESGRFVQRADITDLVFQDAGGRRLDVKARLEVVAWPDRLTLMLVAGPGQALAEADWHRASLQISLRAGETEVSDRADLTPGDTGAAGETRTAAVSLVPSGAGFAGAPAVGLLGVEAVSVKDGQPCPVDHDCVRDWYRINLDGIKPIGEHNDSIERVTVKLTNPDDQERPVHLLLEKTDLGLQVPGLSAITGLSPMWRDADGFPVGIPVQISKNWHRQRDLDLPYQGAWLHAFTLLRLPPGATLELEFTLVYAHWGGVAAASHAQLCLIGWGSNQLWNESALGSWGESICYEPDQAQAESGILDVRPVMVHAMNANEPLQWGWTNNVGGGDFVRYFDPQGRRQFPARMRTEYRRYCPDLTEVTYAGRSQDGKLEHRATVSIYRSDDIVRGVYRLRLDVKQPTDFSRLVLFQIGADTYSYTGERKMALGNEDGLIREWETTWGGGEYRTPRREMRGRVPWISLHEAVSRDSSASGAWANRGLIIRRWEARLGGKRASPWAAEYGVRAHATPTSLVDTDTSVVDILPPPDVTRLRPGDYVEATFEHVVMPQYARDYYGPNQNLRAALAAQENTWRLIYREAVKNDPVITVSKGALESAWPTRIRSADDAARFEVTGGLGYLPLIITGLSSYRAPVLEMRTEPGRWLIVDQSVHGRDFWQADYDADTHTHTWEVTYTVPVDSPGDAREVREFRFRLDPKG